MTILADIAYAGSTMLAKLTYPEPCAGLTLHGAPGDAVTDVGQLNTGRTIIGGNGFEPHVESKLARYTRSDGVRQSGSAMWPRFVGANPLK